MGLFNREYHSYVPKGTWFDVYNANDFRPATFVIGDKLVVPAGYELYIVQNGKIIINKAASGNASTFKIEAFNGLKTSGLIKKTCQIIAFIIAAKPNVFYNTTRKGELKLYVDDASCARNNLPKGFRCPCTFNLYSSIVYESYDVLKIIDFMRSGNIKRPNPETAFFKPASYMLIFIKDFLEKNLFINYPQLVDTRNGNAYISGGEKAKAYGKEKDFLQKLANYLAGNACAGLGFNFKVTVGPLSSCPYEKLTNE